MLSLGACAPDARSRDDAIPLGSVKRLVSTDTSTYGQLELLAISNEIAGVTDWSPIAANCRGALATVVDDSVLILFSVGANGIHPMSRYVIPRPRADQRPVVVRIFMRGDTIFAFDAAAHRLLAFTPGLTRPSNGQYIAPSPGRSVYDIVPGKGETLFVVTGLPITPQHMFAGGYRDIVLAVGRDGKVIRDSVLVTRTRRFLVSKSGEGVEVDADPFDRRLFLASDTSGILYYAWSEIPAVGAVYALRHSSKIIPVASTESPLVTGEDIDVLSTQNTTVGNDQDRRRERIAASAPRRWPPLTILFVGSDGALWTGRGGPAWRSGTYSVIEQNRGRTVRFTAPAGTNLRAACGDTAYGIVEERGHHRIGILTANEQHSGTTHPARSAP